MSTPRVERMNRYIDAQHDPRHPGRGYAILGYMKGRIDSLVARYPDDPALAAEECLAEIKVLRTELSELKVWAEDVAHQSFSPTPHTGAQV